MAEEVKTYQVKCVKCAQKYEDKEPDDYYCPPCLVEKHKIAAEIDAKMKARGPSRKPESQLARYDSLPKVRGFVDARHFL